MTTEAHHCALCRRRDGPLFEINSKAPHVCVACAKRVGRHVLDHAGHAVVWDLEGHAVGVPEYSTKETSRLMYEELVALAQAREGHARVSMETFAGPAHPESPEEILLWAQVLLDCDVLDALKHAAQLLLKDDVPEHVVTGAVRVVFHPRILRKEGIDRLRQLIFKE